MLIWEYLCTLPDPIKVFCPQTPYTNFGSSSFYGLYHNPVYMIDNSTTTSSATCHDFSPIPYCCALQTYEPVHTILDLVRTCKIIYMEVQPLFYARNTFLLPSPLEPWNERAINFPRPELHHRAAHITRFSTIVEEPSEDLERIPMFPPWDRGYSPLPQRNVSDEDAWRRFCFAANVLEKTFPAPVEFHVQVRVNWAVAYRVIRMRASYSWSPSCGIWCKLLARRQGESQEERVERIKKWILDQEQCTWFRVPSRKMKIDFLESPDILDPEAFQTAIEAYWDERDERRREREGKLQLLSNS